MKYNLGDYQKKNSLLKIQYVLNEIEKMYKKGEKMSIYAVQKKLGVSRSFLYNNQEIFNLISKYREEKNNSIKTKETIKLKYLKNRIIELENIIKEQKNSLNDSEREKLNKLRKENDELKEQLKIAYDLYR